MSNCVLCRDETHNKLRIYWIIRVSLVVDIGLNVRDTPEPKRTTW